MIHWLRGLFKPTYFVIEVEKPRTQPTVEGPELRELLRSLQGHPGFRFLTDRLRTQRFALEGRLKATRFTSTTDVEFVQSGIFWTNWVEMELARLVMTPPKPDLPATDQEVEAFHQINDLLERVGATSAE